LLLNSSPITMLTHPLAECVEKMLIGGRRLVPRNAMRACCARRERPRGGRRSAAEQRDELAAFGSLSLICPR